VGGGGGGKRGGEGGGGRVVKAVEASCAMIDGWIKQPRNFGPVEAKPDQVRMSRPCILEVPLGFTFLIT